MANLILLTSDSLDANCRVLPAHSVAEHRIENGEWPFYQQTPNRKRIVEGEKCLIYIAGTKKNSQSFVAKFTVSGLRTSQLRKTDTYAIDAINGVPSLYVAMSDCTIFRSPIGIRALLSRLEFIPRNVTKWGCVMTSGCKKISAKDFNTIIEAQEIEL